MKRFWSSPATHETRSIDEANKSRYSEAGDTLVEVLLAIVILGLASVAILLAFGTSISGSAEHRNLATADTVLRTAAEVTTSLIQQQSSTQWGNCPNPAVPNPYSNLQSTVSTSLPTGWTVQINPSGYPVGYWSSSSASFVSQANGGCVQSTPASPQINSPQQITITVTNSATGVVSSPLSFVVIDPVDRALPVTGTASQLSFYASPSGTSNVAGVPLGKQPVVQLLDSNGNVVTNTLPYIQLSISGTSGASLTGCVGTPHPDGVYYSGCTINQAGTYTLTATDTALANPTVTTVSSFTVVAGPATQLAFTSASPGPGTAGAAIPNVVVQAEDAYGNVATTASGSVAMTIQGGTTFTSGTTTVALSNGVATFSNLVMNTSGAYTFVATPVSISGVTTAITSAVTINPAAASKLAFIPAAPGPGSVASAIPNVGVQVEDPYGNFVTTASGSVTMTIKSGSPQSSFTSGTGTVALSGGAATFSNLVVNTAGSYTFTATPVGITGVTAAVNSSAFTVAKVTPANVVTNSTPTTLGSSVTFTATLSGPTGGTTPTGTVSWTVSGTAGITACTSSTTTLSAGVATCTITVSSAGTYVVTDTYGADTNYLASTSNADTVSVGFTPNLLQIESKSGGTAGTIQAGDHIGVTFPVPISATSVCSGKSGSFSITGTVTVGSNSAPTTGNDELTFAPNTGQCTGNATGFASGVSGSYAGYIDLGSKSFVTTTATIASSTLKFNATTNAIQVTLGATVSGGGSLGTVTTATGTYFPDSAILSSTGVAVSGSVSASNIFTVLQPTATAIASGTTTPNGIPGTGDTITYTFSGQMDPTSILAGWSGASTAVEACFTRATSSASTAVAIATSSTCSTAVNLGSVNLGEASPHYITNGTTVGLTATMSMATVGSTSVVTVTFTSTSASFTANTSKTVWTWTPSASALDLAGNPVSITVTPVSTSKENFSRVQPASDAGVVLRRAPRAIRLLEKLVQTVWVV